MSLKQYLLDNCVEEDGALETKCLVWTGTCNPDGYGYVRYEGRSQNVHRVAWKVFVGPIPEGMQVNHKCDNPPCFRIEHLELGTQLSNIRAMWERGRNVIGNALPDKVVLEARKMADQGYSQTYIAECLGTTQSTVSRIVRGESRASVGGPLTIIDRENAA
jgi:hypothetical protein